MSTLLTSLIRVNAGGGQLPWLETFPVMGSAAGTATLTANRLYLVRTRLAKPQTITKATVFNGATVSGNVDPVIYSSDGTTLTKLVSSGGTALSGANAGQDITLATTTLPAGVDLYCGLAVDNATATLLRATLSFSGSGDAGGKANRNVSVSASYPAPSSIAAASLSTANTIPWVLFS